MRLFDKLFGAKTPVSGLTGDTIVNVWAVVDQKTVGWLQKQDQSQIRSIATGMAKTIADDAFGAIKKWMKKSGYCPTILVQNPFDSDKAVEFVAEAGKRSAEETKVVRDCKNFLVRTGHTNFGGKVAIVLGTR